MSSWHYVVTYGNGEASMARLPILGEGREHVVVSPAQWNDGRQRVPHALVARDAARALELERFDLRARLEALERQADVLRARQQALERLAGRTLEAMPQAELEQVLQHTLERVGEDTPSVRTLRRELERRAAR